MLTIDLRNIPADASPQLETLLARVQQDAERGEWLNSNEPAEKDARQGGSMAGEVWMANDINAPLDDLAEQPPQNGIRLGSLKGLISTRLISTSHATI